MASSKYKHVTYNPTGWYGEERPWQAQMHLKNGHHWMKHCETEREAAKAVDLKLIDLGKEPVNILKRKANA